MRVGCFPWLLESVQIPEICVINLCLYCSLFCYMYRRIDYFWCRTFQISFLFTPNMIFKATWRVFLEKQTTITWRQSWSVPQVLVESGFHLHLYLCAWYFGIFMFFVVCVFSLSTRYLSHGVLFDYGYDPGPWFHFQLIT